MNNDTNRPVSDPDALLRVVLGGDAGFRELLAASQDRERHEYVRLV